MGKEEEKRAAKAALATRWRKWGAFVHPRRSMAWRGASGEERKPGLGAPRRIYRVIIVILVIDYPHTISAAPWLCTPAGTVSIYRIM